MTNQLPRAKFRTFQQKPTVLVDLRNFMPGVEEGCLSQAREIGWQVIEIELTHRKIPPGCNIIGAILRRPADHSDNAWARELTCPAVRVGLLPHALDDRLPAVIVDFKTAGRLAAEHFAERNLRHLALVASEGMVAADVAWETFRQSAEERGCDCHILRFETVRSAKDRDQRLELEARELSEFLQKLPKPMGLLTLNDSVACRILILTQSAGLAVPEDVAVLSCSNRAQTCETALVPLSSIDLGGERQGREAVCLLQRLVNGQKAPSTPIIIPPVGVVERHSTSIFVVPNPAVSRALRLIWDHLEQKISVNEIAREVGLSRRSLEHAFHRCVGRSITAECQRKRLERCAELLRGTQWPIKTIATAAGFTSLSYMYRSFHKKYGVSPSDYREQPRPRPGQD